MKKKLIMLSVCCMFGNEVLGMNADVMRCRKLCNIAVNDYFSRIGCKCVVNNISNRIIEKIDGEKWKGSPYLREYDVIYNYFPAHGELDVNFEKLKSDAPKIILNAMLKFLDEANAPKIILNAIVPKIILNAMLEFLDEANMAGEDKTFDYMEKFIKEEGITDKETGLPTFDLVEKCMEKFIKEEGITDKETGLPTFDLEKCMEKFIKEEGITDKETGLPTFDLEKCMEKFIKEEGITDKETGLPTFDLEKCREAFKFLEDIELERVFGTFNTIVKMLNYENFCDYLMERIQTYEAIERENTVNLLKSCGDINDDEINKKTAHYQAGENIQILHKKLEAEKEDLMSQLKKEEYKHKALIRKMEKQEKIKRKIEEYVACLQD